jgi:hypothetical protein
MRWSTASKSEKPGDEPGFFVACRCDNCRSCRSAVMLGDPFRNYLLQRRASMLALQFPEGRLGQVSEIWPFALFATRGRFNPNDLSQIHCSGLSATNTILCIMLSSG